MTRRGYVAALLAAVVLLVVPVGAYLASRVGEDVAGKEPVSVDGYYPLEGNLACHRAGREVPALPLESDPVAMLVCADRFRPMAWTAPTELVEGDLTALVEVLARLEPAPEGDENTCTSQSGHAYDLVLLFARDRVAEVSGDTGGCGVISTASGAWLGAQDVLDTALELVEEQRDGSTPPAVLPDVELSCEGVLNEDPPTSLTGEASEVVEMVSCWQPDDPASGAWSQTRVPERDVFILVDELARSASPDIDPRDVRCVGGPDHHYYQVLVGRTVWGDVLTIQGECRRFITEMSSEASYPVWHPSPAAQRILDRLRR